MPESSADVYMKRELLESSVSAVQANESIARCVTCSVSPGVHMLFVSHGNQPIFDRLAGRNTRGRYICQRNKGKIVNVNVSISSVCVTADINLSYVLHKNLSCFVWSLCACLMLKSGQALWFCWYLALDDEDWSYTSNDPAPDSFSSQVAQMGSVT